MIKSGKQRSPISRGDPEGRAGAIHLDAPEHWFSMVSEGGLHQQPMAGYCLSFTRDVPHDCGELVHQLEDSEVVNGASAVLDLVP